MKREDQKGLCERESITMRGAALNLKGKKDKKDLTFNKITISAMLNEFAGIR